MQFPSVTQTWPLWLLTVLPLIWIAAWHHRTPLVRWRMLCATALRSLSLITLIVGLTQPVINRNIADVSVVYALDISRSVAPAFVKDALAWMRQANAQGAPAQARYVVFGDRPQLVNSVEAVESVTVSDEPATNESAIGQGATNLEQALSLAAFGFAPNHAKRLVLFSDGNATDGEVWRALPRLQSLGVRIFALPAVVAVNRDAWVEAIELPDGVRQQEPTALRVKIFSRDKTFARINLKIEGNPPAQQSVTLLPGANEFVFKTQFKRAGANHVEVAVAAEGDQVAENNSLAQSLWIGPRPKVLYVESNPDSVRHFRDALQNQGIDVAVASPEAFGAKLSGNDAVVLSDIAAGKLDSPTARRLEAFVREGGGLVFAAGENTYGKEAFSNSYLERLLPVKFEGQRKRKELDLVLLIDRSFSMRGQKLEFAKSAALSTLDLLDEHHRFSVVAFDSRPHDVVPLAEVGNKRRAEDLISGMAASGQTNIYNALWHAYRMLENSPAKTKHMILLSDGNTAPPGRLAAETSSSAAMAIIRKERGLPPEQEIDNTLSAGGTEELTAQLKRANITLSTVAIGENPNLELLTQLARETNGKHHVAKNETEIPALFVTEAKRLLGESMVEESFHPTVKIKTAAVGGIDFAKGPALKGFVLSRAKRFAEVVLEAKDHQPLLVQSHYGLGKSTAFLSDVKNRWASDWLAWPGYAKLWAQVLRDSIKRESTEEMALRVTREGREALVTLTALTADGNYRDDIAPKVRMTAPDKTSAVAPMPQIGPGKFHARIALPTMIGVYDFALIDTLDVREKMGTRSLYYGYSDEYRVLPANVELLKALCERSGGKFAPTIEDIFAKHGDGGVSSKPLWNYFAALGLVMFLLDVLVRRWPGPSAKAHG